MITPLFPTAREPYRGAAIWNTLRALKAHTELSVYCVHPTYPRFIRPRSFRYQTEVADTFQYGVSAQTVTYFALPWATRIWNAQTIYHRLKSQLNRARLDLLLCYWIRPEGCAAVRLGEELGIPVVLGARGTDVIQPGANPLVRKQIRLAVQRADAVLCVSKDLRRRTEAMGALGDRVFTIPNGVDRTIFDCCGTYAARAGLQIPPDCHLVLFVGWLSELKGVCQLIGALRILHQREPGSWRLAVIGEGYLRNALSRQAARLGLAEQVVLLGPKHQAEVARWMKAADVLCLPSETEGCPNVVLEALSVGLPVMATAVGGIPELVNDSCSILIRSRQPADIAEGLQRIAARRWDRLAIARTRARDWDQVASETFRVCELVMEKQKGAAALAEITK